MQLKSELRLMEFLRSSRCVAGQFLQTFQSVHGRGHIQGWITVKGSCAVLYLLPRPGGHRHVGTVLLQVFIATFTGQWKYDYSVSQVFEYFGPCFVPASQSNRVYPVFNSSAALGYWNSSTAAPGLNRKVLSVGTLWNTTVLSSWALYNSYTVKNDLPMPGLPTTTTLRSALQIDFMEICVGFTNVQGRIWFKCPWRRHREFHDVTIMHNAILLCCRSKNVGCVLKNSYMCKS